MNNVLSPTCAYRAILKDKTTLLFRRKHKHEMLKLEQNLPRGKRLLLEKIQRYHAMNCLTNEEYIFFVP